MIKLFDRVKVNIPTTGTGDIEFGAAASTAFLTPAEAGVLDGDEVRYVIVDGLDFEEGVGLIKDTVATMERSVTKSKVSGTVGTSALNLSGTAVLALTASAADILTPEAGMVRSIYDPTSVAADAFESANQKFQRPETGSIPAAVKSRLLDTINAKVDFGADPNGTSDAGPAINAAVAAAGESGRRVWLPEGNYKISTPTGLRTGLWLDGDGMNRTILTVDVGVDGINRGSYETRSFSTKISNLMIQGASDSYANNLIHLDEIDDSIIRDVFIYRANAGNGSGVLVEGTGSLGATRNTLDNVHIANCIYGLRVPPDNNANSLQMFGGRFSECVLAAYILDTAGANNIGFTGTRFESTRANARGIYSAGIKTAASKCRFEFTHASGGAIELTTNARSFHDDGSNYFSLATPANRWIIPAGYEAYHTILDRMYPGCPLAASSGRFGISGTTVVMGESSNVASVARTGLGAYTVSFLRNMTSTNYGVVVTAENGGSLIGPMLASAFDHQVGGFRIITGSDSATLSEARRVSFTVFGTMS